MSCSIYPAVTTVVSGSAALTSPHTHNTNLVSSTAIAVEELMATKISVVCAWTDITATAPRIENFDFKAMVKKAKDYVQQDDELLLRVKKILKDPIFKANTLNYLTTWKNDHLALEGLNRVEIEDRLYQFFATHFIF